MTADALARMRERGHIGIRLGLARVQALLGRLGDPQAALRGVLIGGTNGKGSVAAMVATIIAEAGYSTSQSPSPHLHSYRERIIVDGQPIGLDALDGLLEEVLAAAAPGEPDHGPATEFELLTAAFYLWSARQRVDVVVMEVGLGGRLDASNSWDAPVAAITNVGLDHQEFLGQDVAQVAAEKAAIIKPGARAVTGADDVALEVIETHAHELGVPLTVCLPLPVRAATIDGLELEHPRRGRLTLPLLGRHQAANAAVALGIVDALDAAGVATASADAVERGLARTRWPARLELRMVDGLAVLIDGAHNPDGMAALAATLDELREALPPGPPVLLLGMMAEKEVDAMLAILAGAGPLADARLVASEVPETERSLPAGRLAAAWDRCSGREAEGAHADPDAALSQALSLARESGGPLVVAGSLYLVGHVRARLSPDEVATDG